MYDLLELAEPLEPSKEIMAEGAVLLRGAALPFEDGSLGGVERDHRDIPVPAHGHAGRLYDVRRHDQLRRGRMGHRSDGLSLRPYRSRDGHPWPPMPDCFLDLAVPRRPKPAIREFRPDACLINRYEPGARLSLHQDKNERDFANPIVSVSLGLPATFQFGGLKRNDPVKKFALRHGDVAVWGGPSRLCYHGVSELKDGHHEIVGRMRINLTFRGAL